MHIQEVKDSYGESVIELAHDGAAVRYAGDYLVAVGHDRPGGYYEPDHTDLVRQDPAPFHTVRFDVAVADAKDGRFVPELTVHLRAEKDGRTLAAGRCAFRWHPRLHRYAVDLRLAPDRYDLTVRIAAPVFRRDDPRYCDPALLHFPKFDVFRVRGFSAHRAG